MNFGEEYIKSDLQRKYLCTFPQEFFSFWTFVQNLAGKDNPCEIFKNVKSLRLCGVFDYLAGHLKDADVEKCVLHDRHATDLPEMQTLAVYKEGRFVYWRDFPNTARPLLVHVDNTEHFPRCTVVGINDPFFMIAHLIGSTLTSEYKKFFPKNWLIDYKNALNYVKKITKARKQEIIGAPFHGMGLNVEVINDVGYRPLTLSPVTMKSTIVAAAVSDDESLKRKKMDKVMEIVAHVQFANDEKDYGMGLEFGHDLFWSNYAVFDKIVEKILVMAYKLLDREPFARIAEIHIPVRRNNSN